MSLPRVEVVMSTYRARQDWLEEQLDSIWAQEGVDVSVVVRDDGSPDDTADRVEDLLRGRAGRLVRGENLGPGRSFLVGLQLADPAVPYVAWADQDDVWLPTKLRRAVDALATLPPPALYSARVEIVDASLNHLGLHQLHARGHSFANALVQCAVTGCTAVMDRSAVSLLTSREPSGVVLHDAWAYLVLTGCGATYYDPEPVVRYRQHESNVVGVASTRWGRWSGRARRQLATGHERVHTRQDEELARLGFPLNAEAQAQLDDYLRAALGPWWRRARYAVTGPAHRQDLASDLVYRLLLTLGRV